MRFLRRFAHANLWQLARRGGRHGAAKGPPVLPFGALGAGRGRVNAAKRLEAASGLKHGLHGRVNATDGAIGEEIIKTKCCAAG